LIVGVVEFRAVTFLSNGTTLNLGEYSHYWAKEKLAQAEGKTIESWAEKNFDAKTLTEIFE